MNTEQLVFPGMPGPLVGPGVLPGKPAETADRRRTRRQREVITQGGHPLGVALHAPLALHPQAGSGPDQRRCGNCALRQMVPTGSAERHPKCLAERGPYARTVALVDCPYPRVSAGAGTDVRKWWPACRDHVWGDPSLGPDAARSGPADDIDE